MNRVIISIMGFALIGMFSISARANTVSGKWCFAWGVDYDDDNVGEDYVKIDRPAAYTYVTIQQIDPWVDYIVPVFLGSDGCVDMTIVGGVTYEFKQYTRARRGTRDVYVLSGTSAWSSTNVLYQSRDFTTPSSLASGYTKWIDHPSILYPQTRIMPAVVNALYYANKLAWDDGWDLKISFYLDCDSSEPIDHSCHYAIPTETRSQISLAGSRTKYGAAHEMGHMIAAINGGPDLGSYLGSEGIFRDPVDGYDSPAGDGSHNCDSTFLNGDSHSLTSREFTGSGQGEGWAQFIATAAYNARAATGRFVYATKRMMKWSHSHRGTLCMTTAIFPNPSVPCRPAWDTYSNTTPGNHWEPPHVVEVATGDDDDDFVEWIPDECNPNAAGHSVAGGFDHFGTEYDWLEFYWNVWATDPENGPSIADIADVWAGTDYAYYCCTLDANDDPTACAKKDDSAACGSSPNPPAYTTALRVGKLWSDDASFDVTYSLLNGAQAKWGFGSDEYNLFEDSGGWTKVNL